MPTPHLLCILDGFGWGLPDEGNAIHMAQTPIWETLLDAHPGCLLAAHGTAVGMPSDGDMGNSEVGHNAMGAGRVFDQGAKLVAVAIANGTAWQSQTWRDIIDRAEGGGTVHVLGLVSDGNVHSHVDHLYAIMHRAVEDGARNIRVHVLTDGRDVAPRSSLSWIEPLEDHLTALTAQGVDAAIASVGGRMLITMDRYEADWPMVDRGWKHHVHGSGNRVSKASEEVRRQYETDPDVDDQYLRPFVVGDFPGMQDGDACVLINFRGDRAIEISRAFQDGPDFDRDCFDRGHRPDVFFVGMMEYDGDQHIPRHTLVSPPAITGTVASALAAAGRSTFACSETQKFGHVTYFFNGNRSEVPEGESRCEIPSDLLPFDQAPEMKAQYIVDRAVEAMERSSFDAGRINIANADMVGHTGSLLASVTAIEVLDDCLRQLVEAAKRTGTVLLVTADHGNVEEMVRRHKKTAALQRNADGSFVVSTSHSLNPVPFILFDPTGQWELTETPGYTDTVGSIARIGATLLTLAEVPVPDDYLPTLVRRAPQ
jgi:2,3-bisphosphoglycerate-independent phosphoglycerate mutase